MSLVLHPIPEIPTRQRLRFNTTILRSRDGTEDRYTWANHPRQSLAYRYTFTEAQWIRVWRANLLQHLEEELEVPIWFRSAVLKETAESGHTTLVCKASNFPPMVNATHKALIVHPTGEPYLVVDYTANNGSSITLSSSLGQAFPAGSIVAPIIPGHTKDRPSVRRMGTKAGSMELEIELSKQWPITDTAWPGMTHDGAPVLDNVPLNNSPVDDRFTQDLNFIDFGNAFEVFTGRPRASIVRRRRFLVKDRAYWWRFLDAVGGAREHFFLPTWREDLELYEQPSADSSTLMVTDADPNYVVYYWPSEAHRHILITEDDGSFITRSITSAFDHGDGRIELTLGSALVGTVSVAKISFLERVRLSPDGVTIDHHADHSFIDLSARTLLQSEA